MDAIEQKAKELIDKFWDYAYDGCDNERSPKESAKECAIICCGEVIKILEVVEANTNFWQSVKEKIKSL